MNATDTTNATTLPAVAGQLETPVRQHAPRSWRAVYIGCGDWDLEGPVSQQDWDLAAAAPALLDALLTAEALLYAHGKPIDPAITAALVTAGARAA